MQMCGHGFIVPGASWMQLGSTAWDVCFPSLLGGQEGEKNVQIRNGLVA